MSGPNQPPAVEIMARLREGVTAEQAKSADDGVPAEEGETVAQP